mgnify:CR=1 FL=1
MATANKPMDEWKTIPWKQIERNVFKLQKRIYQVSSLPAEQSKEGTQASKTFDEFPLGAIASGPQGNAGQPREEDGWHRRCQVTYSKTAVETECNS